jgi:hypothetical protein
MDSTKNSSRFALLMSVLMILAFRCTSTKKIALSKAPVEKPKLEQPVDLRKQKEESLKRTNPDRSIEQDAKQALKIMRENAPKVRLNEYFDAIAYAGNTASANNSIKKALTMFKSEEAPVVIVIREQDGKRDYDQPTTIRAYFDYLKTEKKNMDDIQNLNIDNSGKIVRVELKKNYENH